MIRLLPLALLLLILGCSHTVNDATNAEARVAWDPLYGTVVFHTKYDISKIPNLEITLSKVEGVSLLQVRGRYEVVVYYGRQFNQWEVAGAVAYHLQLEIERVEKEGKK